ncbi:MAG: ZIP family metal transporter [Pseudomonadota bacterium]
MDPLSEPGVTSAVDTLLNAFYASFAAGMGTTLGALAVYGSSRLSDRAENMLLSAAAGVMLAASCFGLLAPAVSLAAVQLGGPLVGVLAVTAGLMLGGYGLHLLHRRIPHEHFHSGLEGPSGAHLRRIWLFVIAISLHNFPEGMAVGVGFARGDVAAGLPLAVGIGLQNVPEGLAVAVSLGSVGYSRTQAFLAATLTGLVEPVGGLVGGSAVWLTEGLLAPVMAMAAGAMIFVISDEIIPETHRSGLKHVATLSLMSGFAAMMVLDAALA